LEDVSQRATNLKWKLGGHVARLQNTRWAYISTIWTTRTGKKRRGRPGRRWDDAFKKEAEAHGLGLHETAVAGEASEEGGRKRCRREFEHRFAGVRIHSRSTIHDLVNKVRRTGSFLNKKCVQQCCVLTEGKLDEVGARLEHSPRKSLPRLAQEVNISKTSAFVATKLLKLKPYRSVHNGDVDPLLRFFTDEWSIYERTVVTYMLFYMTKLFSVDGIGDGEIELGEMRPRIRRRLPDVHLTVGEHIAKKKTKQVISQNVNRTTPERSSGSIVALQTSERSTSRQVFCSICGVTSTAAFVTHCLSSSKVVPLPLCYTVSFTKPQKKSTKGSDRVTWVARQGDLVFRSNYRGIFRPRTHAPVDDNGVGPILLKNRSWEKLLNNKVLQHVQIHISCDCSLYEEEWSNDGVPRKSTPNIHC
ncbi:hypothetical protein ANN_10735, partial [Periplaneta americana]